MSSGTLRHVIRICRQNDMSYAKKVTVSLVVVVLLVVIACVKKLTPSALDRSVRDTDRARVRLLCETDHRGLRDACREMLRRVASGSLPTGLYTDSQISQLPEPIPSLQPDHVAIEKNIVKIEMSHTGWVSLGVYAYGEGFPNHPPPFKYGDRKLLEGLWYYDDLYAPDPATYDKWIDKLLRKCRGASRGQPLRDIGGRTYTLHNSNRQHRKAPIRLRGPCASVSLGERMSAGWWAKPCSGKCRQPTRDH
jgi:hypothetical protein